jgi:perosamine synthetase
MKEIPLFAVHMPTAVDKPLLEVVHSGYIGQGKKVDEFEDNIADYLGTKNVLTLNSGTSAIELALHLSGAKPGTSVISTAMTCTATNTSILSRGAEIIWADIDSETGLIDFLDVARKLQENTVAVIGVDWAGKPCAWEALAAVGQAYGISTIEDAAHAFGADYGRRKVGSGNADFTCFSLQAIKSITSVDGGILTCKRTSDYKRGKLLRWYGIDRESDRKDMRCEEDLLEAGWKWHMNDVNATIGNIQLQYLDGIIAAQRSNARRYFHNLKGPKLTFSESDLSDSSFWLCTILCENKEQRLRFATDMKRRGVMVSQVHARNDLHTCFAPFLKHPLPGLDSFTERQISIPVHWKLTESEVSYIIDSVNSFYEKEGVMESVSS